ncbi:hypothetical protein ACRS5S_01085 [Nocardia asiatica]|uniref:hypothetical protein n=1 Tax=Nocardia asiatica TaxID=209252 RepID=UPI0024562152|nr:hypothetical protein [Nocardia asiatica]
MSAPTPAPLDPAVAEILRQSSVGPLLNQPVDQVLASLGVTLPQFPPLPPLPGLPPLPTLDPVALLAPITDMLGQFGSGQLDKMGAVNPQVVLSQIVNGLTQVISLGSSAIGMLAGLAGQGTQAAANKSAQAQGDAAEVSAQAGQINTIVTEAAAAVLTGNAELAAITAKLVTTTAVLAAVPGGQAAIAAAAAEAAAESAAVVAQVRCELEACKGQLECAGQPVAVTSAPTAAGGGSGQQLLQQLVQVAQPVTQLLRQGSSENEQIVRRQTAPQAAEHVSTPLAPFAPGHIATAGPSMRPGLGAASAGTGPQSISRPFQQSTLRTGGAITTEVVTAVGSGTTGAAIKETVTSQTVGSASMMPLASPVAMAARAGDPGGEEVHNPVVAARGEEEYDEATGSAIPVIGVSDESAEPPDRALTL